MSKNRFFVSSSPTALLSMVLVRHEAKQYEKKKKKEKITLKHIPDGFIWGLTEDDLP